MAGRSPALVVGLGGSGATFGVLLALLRLGPEQRDVLCQGGVKDLLLLTDLSRLSSQGNTPYPVDVARGLW